MDQAQHHYEALLGHVYAWSVSRAGDPFTRAAAWLAERGLHCHQGAATYLDLGAGFGAHSVPLARAGADVTAVDFNDTLLRQLRAAEATVTAHEADILTFLESAPAGAWDVVLCLGDTLTHLPTRDAVRSLLHQTARVLVGGGRLALSFRDTTTFAAEGTERFIPVARDAQRTMHCLLEAVSVQHLRVTDIVTELADDGPRTRISDYLKLRLSPRQVAEWAAEAGLSLLDTSVSRGMTSQVYRASA